MKQKRKTSTDFEKGWFVGMTDAIHVIKMMNEEDRKKPNWWEYVERLKKKVNER